MCGKEEFLALQTLLAEISTEIDCLKFSIVIASECSFIGVSDEDPADLWTLKEVAIHAWSPCEKCT